MSMPPRGGAIDVALLQISMGGVERLREGLDNGYEIVRRRNYSGVSG